MREWLEDSFFISTGNTRFARVWETTTPDYRRRYQRIRAELLLLRDTDNQMIEMVTLEELCNTEPFIDPSQEASPASSYGSFGTEATEDESEAATPSMGDSLLLEPVSFGKGTVV
jgi:hypothetical protein